MMKLFGTTDMNVIKDCQAYFGTQSLNEISTKRRCKFLEQHRNRLTACAVIVAFSYCILILLALLLPSFCTIFYILYRSR